jgi:NAD(P)-dependent dehydrogenase (short-subunit alcohol dehydrogenase family)
MNGICEGRVVIVTGAGRGLGREHALAFAREGASIVVNDFGGALDGSGCDDSPAAEVVREIESMGGSAVANQADVADWAQSEGLVRQAVEVFGHLDVVVNNAGFVRDRMIVSTSEDEYDAVLRVHLKGHFAMMKHAGTYWRDRSKSGEIVCARIINTSSGAGLFGAFGQGNYSAAKAGIAAITAVGAAEMKRYGVTVNAIAPAARTRMTEGPFAEMMRVPSDGSFDSMHPGNVSPLVVWLGSTLSSHVSGYCFEVEAGRIAIADGWRHGEPVDNAARWVPGDVGAAIATLLARTEPPTPPYGS